MKHWLFYIKIPKDGVNDIPILKVLLGDPSSGKGYITLEQTDDGEFLYGLYAWTKDEEMFKVFSETRNPKYFIYKKMDFSTDEHEWEVLRSTYSQYEIMYTSYSDDNGVLYNIPTTHFEDDVIADDTIVFGHIVDQYIKERYIKRKLDESFEVVLDTLDESLLKALDLLGWSEFIFEYGFLDCACCTVGRSGDDPDYLIDMYYQNTGFGLGISGFESSKFMQDPLSTYILMIGDLLG